MSVCLGPYWQKRKDKRHHGFIAALREGPTRLGPVFWTCYCGVQEGHFCRECLRGDDSPAPKLDAALCKGNHWRSKWPPHQMEGEVPPSYGLMGPSLLATLHFLASMLRSHNGRRTKGHFPPRQWSPFLCFTFFSWSLVQWQSYRLGQIWPAPRALVYLASGLLLGRPPLLYFFPIVPVSLLGWDLLSQLKAQILLPPGSYLCCPLLHEQRDSTVWTNEMSVGWARMALPIQLKLKNPSQFPHLKQNPLKPEGWWGLVPIINSLKQQGLLISCSIPYNKFKILIKVNFKYKLQSKQLERI
jgi:hypothetical protein